LVTFGVWDAIPPVQIRAIPLSSLSIDEALILILAVTDYGFQFGEQRWMILSKNLYISGQFLTDSPPNS